MNKRLDKQHRAQSQSEAKAKFERLRKLQRASGIRRLGERKRADAFNQRHLELSPTYHERCRIIIPKKKQHNIHL